MKAKIQFDALPDITATEAAYAAGFFDGEGCACIRVSTSPKGRTEYKAAIIIMQADLRPLQWLQDRFGGCLNPHRHNAVYHGRKVVWALEFHGRYIDRFLSIVQPFIIVKSQPVEIMLAFRKHVLGNRNPGKRGVSPEQNQQRSVFREQMRIANRRGPA